MLTCDNFVTLFVLQELSCWRHYWSTTIETAQFLFNVLFEILACLKHGGKNRHFIWNSPKLENMHKIYTTIPLKNQS